MNPGTPVDSNVQPDPATTSDGKNLTPDAWCRKEAAHVVLHEHPPGSFLPRSRKEVEAESVAFVVAAAHGMPTDEYTFPYVAGWASTAKDPAKEVAATLARVARAAKAILEASPAEHLAGGKVPGVQAAVEAARLTRAVQPEPEKASPELGVA
jgi:hypothetical protein